MGSTGKKIMGGVSAAATGGMYSTNGNGLLQGGGINGMIDNSFGGFGGDIAKGIKKQNSVDVPDATARPGWQLSGADGKLRSDLVLNGQNPEAFKQSQGVLNTLQSRANAVGPSQSAQYLQGANNRGMMNSLDDATRAAATGQAQAVGNMAMRGGVDSGNRERMGKSFGMENLMNSQRIRNDARGADLNILAQDEQNKESLMKALPSQLLQQAGFEQDGKRFDIGNTLNTVSGKYKEDMSAWAGNQAAREQAQLSNKKGGALGLGLMGIL